MLCLYQQYAACDSEWRKMCIRDSLIAETLGLWFVNTHLNIPAERMGAANWVYQCSLLNLMLTVVSVPYNSCIVAHEHMKAFAYVSILEACLLYTSVLLPALKRQRGHCFSD